MVWGGVLGGVSDKVPVGVMVPGGIAVEFRGNATFGVKVLTGVAAVVRDGVLGGVGGKVAVGVMVPGGIAVEFRGSTAIGVKVRHVLIVLGNF